MIRAVCTILLATFSPASALAQTLLTGEVFSLKAQDVIVPPTSNWKTSINMMAEEGQLVQPGDVVVEFDGTKAAQELDKQREAMRAQTAIIERDLAMLDKDYVQAEYAVKLAEVQLEHASMQAEIPQGLIGALEYADNRLAAEKAQKTLLDAREQLADRKSSLEDLKAKASLDHRKAELSEALWGEMLQSLTVRATQKGFVLYGIHPRNRTKFQEGDAVQTSFKVAQVADVTDVAIRVWINSVDRPHISAGSRVRIILDALPARSLEGRLDTLSDSGAKRAEWGTAVYFEGIVSFDAGSVPELLPGMSALVEIL